MLRERMGERYAVHHSEVEQIISEHVDGGGSAEGGLYAGSRGKGRDEGINGLGGRRVALLKFFDV